MKSPFESLIRKRIQSKSEFQKQVKVVAKYVGSALVYIRIVVVKKNMDTGDKMGVRDSIL